MTTAQATISGAADQEAATTMAVVDTDVHPMPRPDPSASTPTNAQSLPQDSELLKHLSDRWIDYLDLIGLRPAIAENQIPRHRQYGHRTDSMPPGGGSPGSDPEFAREQLLDAYDMSGAVLNDILPLSHVRGANNYPRELGIELSRAFNEMHRTRWLESDPRWRASINIPFEDPIASAAEIARCRALSDRYVQVLIEARADLPIGNPNYWPIFEAAVEYDIPVAFHVSSNRRITACGQPNYYFEEHCDFALRNFFLVPSLIFEGVFDRFPTLKIAFIELGWSWAVPLAWRLDSTWRVLRSEVPHLQRKPSEYVREHCWFSTQPMEEPENLEWAPEIYEMFDEFGLGDKLMFSSDYPHWDFDAPSESIPSSIPRDLRRRVLGENASRLYKIPLRPDSGLRLGE